MCKRMLILMFPPHFRINVIQTDDLNAIVPSTRNKLLHTSISIRLSERTLRFERRELLIGLVACSEYPEPFCSQ